MAVTGVAGVKHFAGLSSDAKPVVDSLDVPLPVKSTFWETDTSLNFVFTGGSNGVWRSSADDIHDLHVHHDLWNHFAFRDTGNTSTLAGATAKNEYEIELVSAVGFSVDKFIDLHFGVIHAHVFHKIIAINANVLTLGSRIDQVHAIGSAVNEVEFNMAASVGTMADPVIFAMLVGPGEVIHLNRFLITLSHQLAGDFSKFGSRAALTNGVQMRVNRNNGEEYETQTVWRTNKDLKEDMFDVDFDDKAGAGDFGTSGRWTMSEADTIIRLDGDNNDKIEFLLPDDMTTGSQLLDFQIKGQAHYERGGRD